MSAHLDAIEQAASFASLGRGESRRRPGGLRQSLCLCGKARRAALGARQPAGISLPSRARGQTAASSKPICMALRLNAVADSIVLFMTQPKPWVCGSLWNTRSRFIPYACRHCQGLFRDSAASSGGSKGGTRRQGFFRACGEPPAHPRAHKRLWPAGHQSAYTRFKTKPTLAAGGWVGSCTMSAARRFLSFSWKALPPNEKRSD